MKFSNKLYLIYLILSKTKLKSMRKDQTWQMFKFFKICTPVAVIKEFERRFKFKPQLKYGWFHLKLYQMFPDLS